MYTYQTMEYISDKMFQQFNDLLKAVHNYGLKRYIQVSFMFYAAYLYCRVIPKTSYNKR